MLISGLKGLKEDVKFICYERGTKKKYEFPVRIQTPASSDCRQEKNKS